MEKILNDKVDEHSEDLLKYIRTIVNIPSIKKDAEPMVRMMQKA